MSADERLVKQRFLALHLVRLAGVGLLLTGLLVIAGRLDWPQWLGFVLVAVGLFDSLVMPLMLSRRWRTPR